ncbi:hypothetical protein TNCV_3209101 [Trichonephila clavipes]|nr:hypothetical protein TNCV_3209101 [Trichonephila clavipes]
MEMWRKQREKTQQLLFYSSDLTLHRLLQMSVEVTGDFFFQNVKKTRLSFIEPEAPNFLTLVFNPHCVFVAFLKQVREYGNSLKRVAKRFKPNMDWNSSHCCAVHVQAWVDSSSIFSKENKIYESVCIQQNIFLLSKHCKLLFPFQFNIKLRGRQLFKQWVVVNIHS